jgi:hypothetical protein
MSMMMRRISHHSSNQSVGNITKTVVKSTKKQLTKKPTLSIRMNKNIEKENKRKTMMNRSMLVMLILLR